ncbi:MAG: hypothetical protein Kow00124_10140 [Anaerolineae bacterium]
MAERRPVIHAGLLLLAALVILLAFGLRVHRLEAQSLWYDEGNSAALAARSLPEIVRGAAADIHPPGYYVLLAGWTRLVGASEFALRALSLLFSTLTAAVMMRLGRRLFGSAVGLLAGLLTAIHPLQVYYAQEARMYALLALLSALSIWLTAEVLALPGEMAAGRFSPRRAAPVVIGYVLVHAAGLYTHFSYPFVILAESLVFLLWLARRSMKLHGLAVWGLLQVVSLLLFLPWLPTAIRQVMGWPRGVMEQVPPLTIAAVTAYGITFPVEQAAGALIPLAILAVVGVFPPAGGAAQRRGHLRFDERAGLVLSWLLVLPLALVAVRAMTAANLKFLLPPALALCLLAARGLVIGWGIGAPLPGLAGQRGPLMRGVVLVLALVGGLPWVMGLANLYTNPAYARDDYRALAARIMAEAGPEAGVVLVAPNQREVFTYYYPDGPGITPLPAGDQTAARLDDLLARYDRIYAVYWGDWQPDPERTVERALEARAFPVRTDWFGTVRLVTYAVPEPVADQIETPGGARFGESITLLGYTLSDTTLRPGAALGVTLFWQIDQAIQERYKVFVHLYGPDGTIAAQHDSEPGGDLKPTWIWQPGETVVDGHGLLIPADLPPGRYPLVIGMYRAFDPAFTRLPVTQNGQASGDSLQIAWITVSAGQD